MGMTSSVTRYQCRSCGRFQQSTPRHNRSARILLLDIETLPMEFYGWSPYNDYVRPENVIKDWSVACWSAKWLFEPEIIGQVVTPKEAIGRTEGSVLEGIWRLIDKADIVVTQNGIKFDMKKLNTKFLVYGYPPPSNYLNVDTLKVAKETFNFSYNRLDELGKQLGIGTKKDMEFKDWITCAQGSKPDLLKMLDYCKNDVAPLLEDVYLRMLPWMKNHPNLGIYADHDLDVCPRCESTDLSWGGKYYPTPMGLWDGFRCNACSATGRGHGKIHKAKSVYVSSVVPS